LPQRSQSRHRVYRDLETNDLTYKVIGAAIEVHKRLGPGLLEKVYQECMLHEFQKRGLSVEMEFPISVIYDDIEINSGYRIDLLVENKLVVELKSVDAVSDLHKAQILTYMKLGEYKVGLLINFNVTKLANGINRFVNGKLENEPL
jgi:GxxExxY protein